MSRKYAIVDIETTGGSMKRDRIIEIAIAVHDGAKIIDTFESLIKPGRSISGQISRLTGITNEMLVDAPFFYEVAKKVVQMTEDCIFVAHNSRFDYGFIKKAFENLGYTYTRKQLCTVRLSKMLLPELRRHGLDHLMQHFGIVVANRHRAMVDVEVTSDIFLRLLKTPASAEALDSIVNNGIKASRLPAAVSLDLLHSLPESCGVYYFHNDQGVVIYVGKSINIKKRVMQHFAVHTAKGNRLAQRVADITFEITGSELVALLLEEKEIKRLQPEVNRQLRTRLFPFALYHFVDKDGYLNLKAEKIKKSMPPEFTMIKEYPKLAYARGHLKGLIEEFQLCQHRCGDRTGVGECFNYKIRSCHGACLSLEPEESYNARAQEAIDYLRREVRDNFFIIDEGREHSEKSVVMVENGQFKGFGFADEGTVIDTAEGLKDIVSEMPQSRDAQRIIHWYVKEDKMEKLIRF